MDSNGKRDYKAGRVKLVAFILPETGAFIGKYNDRPIGVFIDQLAKSAEFLVSSADHPYNKYGLSVVDMENLILSIIHDSSCSCKICFGEYEKIMINLPKKNAATTQNETKASSSIPFLSIRDLTATPIDCEILDVRAEGCVNNDVEILLKHPVVGERIWGLRLNNPRLPEIVDAYTPDEKTWKTKHLLMFTSEDTFRKSTYIACRIPEPTPLPKPVTKK